jgi:hypothetical protein
MIGGSQIGNRKGGMRSRGLKGITKGNTSQLDGGSSHIIVDDASEGYNLDQSSAMDYNEIIGEYDNGKNTVFMEGDSDIIDEDEEELDTSFENRRKRNFKKRPASLKYDSDEDKDTAT